MAKKSQRRSVRYERDQSGCMWGLMSMFDFRHGRLTQKLISDRRRGSRQSVGGTPKSKFDNLDENCQGTLDEQSMRITDGAGKPSVKKLIEEEMFSEQVPKKEISKAEVELKQSNSEKGNHKTKNRKRTKSSTKSVDIHLEDLDVAEGMDSELPCLQSSEKQSTTSLDIGEIVEDFSHWIHQKNIVYVKHEQHGEVNDQPNQKNPDFEEKLSEIIKLISEKFINRKHVIEDRGLQPSKEVRDVLQILSSDEELFLKLLQGPKSMLVKHVQKLWNAQVEKDEESKSLVGSNLSEQELHDLRHSDDVIHGKQRNFFRRKTKSLEKNPSKESKVSQASNRIVILKPGPTGSQISKNESSFDSSPASQFLITNKEPNERFGSPFLLSEIKRKLKNAMGKERQEISANGTLKKFPYKHQVVVDGNEGLKEGNGRNSPSKDHFFFEKIARPPMGGKKREKTDKLKGSEIRMEREAIGYSKQSVSNIYIEAKKHLSEMLSTGPGDVDFSDGQIPKTLGRILSLPEYNFSPMDSPGRNWEQGFLTAQMRFSANDKFQKQENSASHLGRAESNSEAQPSGPDDSTDDKAPASSNQNTSALNDLHEKEEEKALCSVGIEMTSEGDIDNVRATETMEGEEGNILVDNTPEPSRCPLTKNGQNGDISEAFDQSANSERLEHDPLEENQPQSPPSISPSTSSGCKKFVGTEGFSETPDRPSPISVLEPLFIEEDISPASSRSQPVELPVQPLKIQFEEPGPSAADQSIPSKTSIDDKILAYEYVKAVLQASGLSWDEFYMRSHSSEQLLDSSIYFEVEFCSSQLCCDKKLLFDCINEVLMEVYGRYFGCFLKSTIRPNPDMKNAICEVWEGLYWHLLPLPLPHSLDQLVKKDMGKTGIWMDLRYDTESILVEVGESILDDLMEETIFDDLMELSLLSRATGSSENGKLLVSADLKEKESSDNF